MTDLRSPAIASAAVPADARMPFLTCPRCRSTLDRAAAVSESECADCGAPLVATPRPLPPARTFEGSVMRLLTELSGIETTAEDNGAARRGREVHAGV